MNAKEALDFCINVINNRSNELEELILSDEKVAEKYLNRILLNQDPIDIGFISSKPILSYHYSCYLRRRFEDGEKAIFSDIKLSIRYAIVHKFRIKEVEDFLFGRKRKLSHDNNFFDKKRIIDITCAYINEVIAEKDEELERKICNNANYAYSYAIATKSRFIAAEEVILKDNLISPFYAIRVLRKRWPEYEKKIETTKNRFAKNLFEKYAENFDL